MCASCRAVAAVKLEGWSTHFLAKRWQLGPSRPPGYPRDGCQSQRLLATSSIVVKMFGAAEMACAFSHPKSDILRILPHGQHHRSWHAPSSCLRTMGVDTAALGVIHLISPKALLLLATHLSYAPLS